MNTNTDHVDTSIEQYLVNYSMTKTSAQAQHRSEYKGERDSR